MVKMADKAACNARPVLSLAVPGACRKRVLSDALLGEAREIVIVHEGAEYVLRLTKQNKLILTK